MLFSEAERDGCSAAIQASVDGSGSAANDLTRPEAEVEADFGCCKCFVASGPAVSDDRQTDGPMGGVLPFGGKSVGLIGGVLSFGRGSVEPTGLRPFRHP